MAADGAAVDGLPPEIDQPGVKDLQEWLRVLAPVAEHSRLPGPQKGCALGSVVALSRPRHQPLDRQKPARAMHDGPGIIGEISPFALFAEDGNSVKVRVSSRGSGLPGADLQLGLGAFSRNLTMPKRIGQNTVEGVAGQPHPNDPVEDLEIEDTSRPRAASSKTARFRATAAATREPAGRWGVRPPGVVDLVDRVE